MRARTLTLTRSAVLALAAAAALSWSAGATGVSPRVEQQALPRTQEPHTAPQPTPPIAITVDSGRPLSDAIDELVQRFKWTVTYEDPRYLAPQDMEDVTLTVSRTPHPTRKVLVPRGGPFAFELESPADGRPPDPASVLGALITAHDTYGYAAEFRLIQAGDIFHVVPRASRSAAGRMEETGSLLDVRISVADGTRPLAQVLEEIVSAVASASGEQIHLGMFPMNLVNQTKVNGAARNEPARDVLVRSLAAARLRLSWHLFHGPKYGYVLNIHIVDRDSITSRANR